MWNRSPAFLLSLAMLAMPNALSAQEKKLPPYPASKTEPVNDRLHGVEVPDPYRWLEDGNAPAVKEWVEKQNAYTRELLDKLPGRDKLRERLGELLDIGTIG